VKFLDFTVSQPVPRPTEITIQRGVQLLPEPTTSFMRTDAFPTDARLDRARAPTETSRVRAV
jgi:hypothetical protein